MPKSFGVIAFALGLALGGLAGTSAMAAAAATLQEGPQTSSADANLQGDIQNTLDKQPNLAGRGIRVTVTEQQIELTGNVNRSRDKLTAARIALSYGANKKLVNRIAVTGGSGKAPEAGAGAQPGQSPKAQGEQAPATNAPGKVSQPPLP
jgi:osmotically-inducible protein OsmY